MGLDLYTILQTAAEIADKEGLEAVTLATLAKKLGIPPPVFVQPHRRIARLEKATRSLRSQTTI